MCDFNYLQIGQQVIVTSQDAICGNCAKNNTIDETVTTYYGHEIMEDGLNYHVFRTEYEMCPHCGKRQNQIIHICDDNPSLEIAYKMELPIDHDICNQ